MKDLLHHPQKGLLTGGLELGKRTLTARHGAILTEELRPVTPHTPYPHWLPTTGRNIGYSQKESTEAAFLDIPEWLDSEIADQIPFPQLYTHQVSQLTALRKGENAAIFTGTASGKTWANLPYVLQRVFEGKRVLYLMPLNALVQDQFRIVEEVARQLEVTADFWVGGRSTQERDMDADIVLTNSFVLDQFLRKYSGVDPFDFVVIDEAHYYAGASGASAAAVVARLKAANEKIHGIKTQFAVLSATVAEKSKLLENLTGEKDWTITTGSGAAQAEKEVYAQVFGKEELMDTLINDIMSRSDKRLVFADSIYTLNVIRGELIEAGMDESIVACYYRGVEDTVKDDILEQFNDGGIRVLLSTSALEAGVDFESVPAVFMIASLHLTALAFWQRVGRAGRGDQRGETYAYLPASLGISPQRFINRPLEKIYPCTRNLSVHVRHASCASVEVGLEKALEVFCLASEEELFTLNPHSMPLFQVPRKVKVFAHGTKKVLTTVDRSTLLTKMVPGSTASLWINGRTAKYKLSWKGGKLYAKKSQAKYPVHARAKLKYYTDMERKHTGNRALLNVYSGRVTVSYDQTTLTERKKGTETIKLESPVSLSSWHTYLELPKLPPNLNYLGSAIALATAATYGVPRGEFAGFTTSLGVVILVDTDLHGSCSYQLMEDFEGLLGITEERLSNCDCELNGCIQCGGRVFPENANPLSDLAQLKGLVFGD